MTDIKKFLNTLWEFTGVKEDKDNFIQKALKVCKVFKVKPLQPDIPSRKTACNLFCKDIRKTKKELQGVPVSKPSAIISKEWKKVKASEKKMKKYKDLYEEEKQRHDEALQRYKKDHMDEVEIINLHKRCNKTDTKAVTKTAAKAPKSGYHLFLREQLDKMTGEDRKNCRSIVSRRWKEIKEDPEMLSAYNDRAKQMKNEAEKPGDYSQNEKTVVDRPAVKKPQKAPKTPAFIDTDSDDEQEPVVKQPQKAPKTSEFVDTDSDDTDDEQEPAVKCLVM